MDDLLSSIRNDLLKICFQVNIIKEEIYTDSSEKVNRNDSTSDEDIEQKVKKIGKEIKKVKEVKKVRGKNKKSKEEKDKECIKDDECNKDEECNKVENDEDKVIIKIKNKRKEVQSEDRCTKFFVKNGIESRCSFRKIEEKDFCKKHLK